MKTTLLLCYDGSLGADWSFGGKCETGIEKTRYLYDALRNIAHHIIDEP